MNASARLVCLLLTLAAFAVAAAPAGATGTITILHSFAAPFPIMPYDNSDGFGPTGLIPGPDGDFYGTTVGGGVNGGGTVFKITPSGTLTTLASLGVQAGTGDNPTGGLVLASDGNFYGTTQSGGTNGTGTLFKITPAGILTTISSFGIGADFGIPNPDSALAQGSDGTFYGTTVYNTIFQATTSGAIMNFTGQSSSPLTIGRDGDFYYTLDLYGHGSVIKYSPSSGQTTYYLFTGGDDGADPLGSLIQGSDGNIYGTTSQGGANNTGTVFKFTPSGTLTTLASLGSDSGTGPQTGLVQGSDGNFYGATGLTVFQVTPSGTLTTIATFNGTNSDYPIGSLVQGSDGSFYGTTPRGGANNTGTVFQVALPATPSPTTITSVSPSTVQQGNLTFTLTVTGTGFTSDSTVLFNGVNFLTPTSISPTKITVTIASDLVATPGAYTVAIANSDAMNSNSVPFPVTPGLTITGISPATAPVGIGPVSITVTGTDFINGAIVKWNRLTSLPTYYLSPTEVTADVPASLLATAGSAQVTIANPHVYPTMNPRTFVVEPTGSVWRAVAVDAGPSGMGSILWDDGIGNAGVAGLDADDTQINTGNVTPQNVLYQRYGLTAKAITGAKNGTASLLWTGGGGASISTLDASGVFAYGPANGGIPQALGEAGDGTLRLLTSVSGVMNVSTLSAGGMVGYVTPSYGPFSGWTAVAIAAALDGTSRVLWTNTDGRAGIWSLDTGDYATTVGPAYGPFPGWTAVGVGVAGDGTSRVLWSNADGAAGLWSFDVNDVATRVGPSYGPFSDSNGTWSATAMGTASDGTSRVLWKRSDGAAGVWSFDASDTATVVGPIYTTY